MSAPDHIRQLIEIFEQNINEYRERGEALARALSMEIDGLIYQLYRLNAEEISIVEGTGSSA